MEISGLEGHWEGGGELQCGGLRPLCESLLGGSSVEEGVGQPDGRVEWYDCNKRTSLLLQG